MERIISENKFSAIEGEVEVRIIEFTSGRELWIHAKSQTDSVTFDMNEAELFRNYINSLKFNKKSMQ